MVGLSLLILKKYLGKDFSFSSDGDEEDWKEIKQFYSEIYPEEKA
jgi:hypothetical protein